MTRVRLLMSVLLAALLVACAAKAQVRTEVPLPLLDPPPPPPRVITVYRDEPTLPPLAPAAEAAVPTRPAARPARPEARPEPPSTAEVVGAAKPVPLSLTLTPSPGSEAQTAAAIGELMARAARDLARVNVAALNTDGRAQVEAARRFLQQADEALKARNVVFAGKLADKAATIAAVLVR